MFSACYKCGKTLDEFPSHLCVDCRRAILARENRDEAIENLAKLLTADDLIWLRGQYIKIDDDMVTDGNRSGFGSSQSDSN
jgi:hypothetical protein